MGHLYHLFCKYQSLSLESLTLWSLPNHTCPELGRFCWTISLFAVEAWLGQHVTEGQGLILSRRFTETP